ncbi:cytochrome C oxidase subunit IV family protein [Haloarcula nitratireducens]|uniref:Cytochrome C oxidase subunit IV family protein n=1 Tax=Haloarcula nitratireducens TaxID=2487749 RepID=A0AAW4PBP2_9EURY|nr:cytochrome C oxidase subunit IV family protein [Halomicroarcula nitratireducens]MBX0295412.1 cytochrome C oxidase subunit IV family protein [Halomicroarcula nitratireducens]
MDWKGYTVIYVVLFAFATAQAVVEFAGLVESAYWLAFGVIMVLSVIKAVGVAAYYQHLRWEPRSVTYLVLGGTVAAMALTFAAAYSIL